ncbi:MAG: hypothetical protein JWM57_4129 [Phycisphaerales bacterium]|nr:hypothetical protein [Phycisphaerales bacterium]
MRTRAILGVVLVAITTNAYAAEDPILAKPANLGKEAGTPIVELIAHLRINSGQMIFVNWKALEAAGVRRTVPVTVDLSNLTVGQATAKLVKQFDYPPLDFTVDEGVVTISVLQDLHRNVETRCYDVRTLVALNDAERPKRIDALLRRVQGINPLTWKANGSGSGNVQELGGQLIVTQTPAMQRRVAIELGDGLSPAEQARLLQVAEMQVLVAKPVVPLAPTTPMGRTLVELKRELPDVRFNDFTLGDALDFVRHSAGISIDVEWDQLAKAKMKPDHAVNLRLRNISVRKVLASLLEQATNVADPADAASFSIRPDGHVVITSRRDQFARFAETKSFAIGDLVAAPADAGEARKELSKLITETVAVQTWATEPEPVGGTASIDGDTLRVNQTPDVLQQIDDLLKTMRDQRTQAFVVPAR